MLKKDKDVLDNIQIKKNLINFGKITSILICKKEKMKMMMIQKNIIHKNQVHHLKKFLKKIMKMII